MSKRGFASFLPQVLDTIEMSGRFGSLIILWYNTVKNVRIVAIRLGGETMQLNLTQKQTTELKMTPKLQQTIDMQKYNKEDLRQYNEEQAVQNPLNELEEKDQHITVDVQSSSSFQIKQPVDSGDYVNAVDNTPQTDNEVLDDILQQIDFLN